VNDRGAEGTESGKESLECGCVVDLLHPKYCKEARRLFAEFASARSIANAFGTLTEHRSKGNRR
jgi:hypothetical protein